MDGEDFVFEASGSDTPDTCLVILFGWAGCKDRYLSKYSAMYGNAGVSIVRYTADIKKIRAYYSYGYYARAIYENVLRNNNFETILCHVFSMNGCSMFCGLWEVLDMVDDGETIKRRFKGVIFDSSPAYTGPWRTANAVSLAVLPPAKYGQMARGTYKMILVGYLFLFDVLLWLRSYWQGCSWENNYAYYRMLSFADLPAKQMFMYSDADTICIPQSIEQYIRMQEKQKVDVKRLCFKDSLHCEHFRTYRDEYEKCCVEFLRCIIDRN